MPNALFAVVKHKSRHFFKLTPLFVIVLGIVTVDLTCTYQIRLVE